LSLADLLRTLGTPPPPAKPRKAPNGLAALIESGALPKPANQLSMLEEARERMRAAGRFSAEGVPLTGPVVIQPTGLFGKIASAGPKKKGPKTKDPAQIKKLSLALLLEMGDSAPTFGKNTKVGAALRAQGVGESPELARIVALPRRPSDFGQYPDLTEMYRKPGGTMSLWPVQNAILHEAKKANGLLAIVGAGFGKTIGSLLVGDALGAKRIVLLVPPQLRAQLITKDIPHLNRHFRLPLDRLTVVAYSELSNARSADILDQLKPDLIVSDECHNLRHRAAARTKRFLRYLKENPGTRFVGLSGTITRRSLIDFGHLAELALKARSPVPHNYFALSEWAEALDVGKEPLAPGALRVLCTPEEILVIDSSDKVEEVQQAARSAFRRRLVETTGVVATEEGAIGTSLVLTGLRPTVPLEIQGALKDLRDHWEVGGDELVDILSVTRAGAQIAAGFYTRWVWPDNIPDREWLEARSAWMKELREILKLSRRGLDSPMLVANAIARGEMESQTHAAWAAVRVRYNPEPPREEVWISEYLVAAAVEWAATCDKTNPGIIWFTWRSLGEKIAKAGNFPFFGGGDAASRALTEVNVRKTPVIVASVRAHGQGLNLQAFSRNLFTTPVGGLEAEQAIARTHRPGQEADQVDVDIFVHTEELRRSFLNSLRDAHYVETTSGQRQKLLYAERIDLPEE
jgi:cold shock CspA family protein